jgi:predicted nucleotidyltransferase
MTTGVGVVDCPSTRVGELETWMDRRRKEEKTKDTTDFILAVID